MGYSITILKPDNIDNRFKPFFKNIKDIEDCIEDDRNIIILDVMKYSSDISLNASKDMRLKLKFFVNTIEEYCKLYIKNNLDETGEFTMCGWEYSRDTNYDRDVEINNAVQNLLLLKYSVKEADYFSDNDNWSDKLSDIKDTLSSLEESISDIVYHDFIYTYKGKYEKKYNDDDDDTNNESCDDN